MDANPIGLIILAIAALIAIVVVVITHFNTLKKWFTDGWERIKEAFVAAWNFIKKHYEIVIAALFGPVAGLIAVIVRHWDTIKEKFIEAWHHIRNAFAEVINFLMKGVEEFVNFFIKGLDLIIKGINLIPGVNIPLIQEVHLNRIPILDTGAYVAPQSGGTIARLAANGVPEYVLTPSQLAAVTNNANKLEVHVHITGNDITIPDESYLDKWADKISAKIAGQVNLKARFVTNG